MVGYGVLMADRPACRVIVKTELFPSWCSLQLSYRNCWISIFQRAGSKRSWNRKNKRQKGVLHEQPFQDRMQTHARCRLVLNDSSSTCYFYSYTKYVYSLILFYSFTTQHSLGQCKLQHKPALSHSVDEQTVAK